ncbi:Lipase B [Pseudocercospora fuligena]|uniref:Lipase B n=1 Tax=Pseudocercospora fuligena TaxID=685502 RepID=A0A8H6VJU2_9PEZI|nr:Lipase B [Pseudocercospora fuligena]
MLSKVLLTAISVGLSAAQAASKSLDIAGALSAINNATPTARPSTLPQATSALSKAFANPTDYVGSAVALVKAGFDPADIQAIVEGYSPADNSINNVNTRNPSRTIYPRASTSDPAYSLPEASLRAAIRIPSTFTFGQKPPVILFPGTGVPGGITYAYNYGRLLAKESYADPLWVNIPKYSLADAQLTAEYAAYAMNYIAGITNRNVTVITFSQGSLNVQWAFKYWKSTRSITTNLIALSPDYHGTVNAELICPPVIGPCTPAVLQQYYNSTFVSTLLANDGDSAYVPTTNVRSSTDQIVQPQTGAMASGVLKDVRGVGVTNVLVQDTCPLSPAGTLVTHEGILYNALAYALAIDVLKNGGPGQLSRINLPATCSKVVADGMTLNDLIATEASFVVFFTNFLTCLPKAFVEPGIKAYAA